jgi:putative endonuclease
VKKAPDTRIWSVYIVECARGGYYTGIALDVRARVAQHNAGKGAKAVKALGLPVQLRITCPVGTKSAALKLEAAIKKLPRNRKIALLGRTTLEKVREDIRTWLKHLYPLDLLRFLL